MKTVKKSLLVSLCATAMFYTVPSSVMADGATYTPPNVDSPARRVGGGTRGTAGPIFELNVLAPADHTGHSADSQPTLYWSVDGALEQPASFTLVYANPASSEMAEPLIEDQITVNKSGIQSIRLSEYDVALKTGVDYQWSISVVIDQTHRSKDIVAGATIRLAETPATLLDSLNTATSFEKPALYASAGFWYNAVDSLSKLIEAQPDDSSLVVARNELLKQVGLEKVASNN
ncbi:MAG: DUF928 domain-containing protein [Pseudomonadota bacterium]